MNLKAKFIQFLEDYRGLVVVIFCLPASLIFTYITRLVINCQNFLTTILKGDNHDNRVKYIQQQVKKWNKIAQDKRKFLVNARPNWLSLSTKFFKKKDYHQISVPLYQILSIDEESLTVKVEPYVTIGNVTKYLVPRGYMVACTIEIEDATCGGLAMGVGMSTHSHKVGLFQESVVSYGVVLPNGDYIEARADNEYADLYYNLSWSHGSLAILVSLELKIIRIEPYLRLRYRPVVGMDNYCNQIRHFSGALKATNENIPDFLEATVFSKNEAVIMMGDFVASSQIPETQSINQINRWYKPYFYKHVETFLKMPVNETGYSGEEVIRIEDYLFRHNRAIFWVLEAIIPFCHNPLFRFVFGGLCPPKPAFLKFTTTKGIREMTFVKQVFQDIVLPMTVLEKSIELSEDLFDLYPILIYPCRIYGSNDRKGLLRAPRSDQMTPGTNYGMFYDLGVYGIPGYVKRHEFYDAGASMRGIEKFIRDNGGYSFLYADIFMTRDELEEMFNLEHYEKVRKKYQSSEAFPHLYDKVKPECDVFEISKKYAALSAIEAKTKRE